MRAAYPAIKAADPGVPVLIGALAPRGQSSGGIKSVISPLTFVRDMGCVNSKFRRMRSGMCTGFKPATGDGFAYHAYGVNNLPDQPFPDPNDIDLASLPRLESTLDKPAGHGRAEGDDVDASGSVPRRVRLPDQPARQDPRRHARPSRTGTCSRAPTWRGATRG